MHVEELKEVQQGQVQGVFTWAEAVLQGGHKDWAGAPLL